eukprot:3690216-Rhodomonas_salina.1
MLEIRPQIRQDDRPRRQIDATRSAGPLHLLVREIRPHDPDLLPRAWNEIARLTTKAISSLKDQHFFTVSLWQCTFLTQAVCSTTSTSESALQPGLRVARRGTSRHIWGVPATTIVDASPRSALARKPTESAGSGVTHSPL